MRYSVCMNRLVLIAHNLRSSHNVGSLLRTSEGFGIEEVYLSGHTPYPLQAQDERLPHLAKKQHAQISKTALGAEKSLGKHTANVNDLLEKLHSEGFVIAALEQAPNSQHISDYKTPEKLAIIAGREVEGIEPEILDKCDVVLEIPMQGQKESFNVSVAAAIAIFHSSLIGPNL